MEGKKVRIRPVRRDDLPFLESWVNNVEILSIFNDFGFEGHNSMESAFEKEGLISDHQATIIVETLEGEVVGGMSYYQTMVGPREAHRIYGIGLHLSPEHRGKGYGTEAQILLADYLFNTYPIARVEAETDVENFAEQRSLEKAGFTREGVRRKAQWRHGDWHDLILFSKLRGE
ncbi:MAG: GNAT family protein [Candidatus Promineifilaceae bacterium]